MPKSRRVLRTVFNQIPLRFGFSPKGPSNEIWCCKDAGCSWYTKPCELMYAIQGMASEAEEMAGRKIPYGLLAPQLGTMWGSCGNPGRGLTGVGHLRVNHERNIVPCQCLGLSASCLPCYRQLSSSRSCCRRIVYSSSEGQVPLEPSSETVERSTPFFPGHVSLGYFGHGDVEVAYMPSVLVAPKTAVALQRSGQWGTHNRRKTLLCRSKCLRNCCLFNIQM